MRFLRIRQIDRTKMTLMKTSLFTTKRSFTGSLLALGFTTLSTSLIAQPVLTYSVSGSSGDYTLDFTVNNTTPGTQTQDIYLFGVDVPNGSFTGGPAGYATSGSFDNATVNLLDSTYSLLPSGTTLSGFDVFDSSATAPTSVPYYAYGYDFGADYTGPDNLGDADNPLFEGNAVAGANVPDSAATMPMLGVAFGALAGFSRKFRKA
jgi:hypothetical protein